PQNEREGRVCEDGKRPDGESERERRGEAVPDHFRSEQRQRQTSDPDSQAEDQAEKGNVHDRFPFACPGRSEAEGARGGMRYGAAALGVLAEPAAVVTPSRGAGRGIRRVAAGAVPPAQYFRSTPITLPWISTLAAGTMMGCMLTLE